MLQPGGATNLFAVTLAGSLSTSTNENARLEAFWNPQDPLGIVRDREIFAPQLSPLGLWNDMDIGSVGLTGGSALSGSSFTVLGSGADIWGTADACHFLYRTNAGDATLTARVTSQTAADAWSKAGVMIRESTAAGARQVFMCLTPNNGVNFQNRPTPSGSSYTVGTAGPVAPYWVRLVRSGTIFSAYASANGTAWTQIGGSTNLSGLGASALWGLAVTAHTNGLASVATFDSVSLDQPVVNHPPVLSTNANQVIVAGATLLVTNTATDPESPPEVLTFSLPGAPTNAAINPITGVLTWRPLISQAPVVTSLRVVVSDNGSPVMSATQSFWVTVNKPVQPGLGAPGFSNGLFRFSIWGDAGPDYTILGSTNLVNWQPVLTNSSAVPPFVFTDAGTINFTQRFYRVMLGP
jgi:regulation of enolase protein 1 (concanavalin A-like superfamily)